MQSDGEAKGPADERWASKEQPEELDIEGRGNALDIFSLSAGVMAPRIRTANRIDGLLTRMLENPSSGKYIRDIDRNLDYLYTHMQLDMLERIGKDVSARASAMRERSADARIHIDELQRD